MSAPLTDRDEQLRLLVDNAREYAIFTMDPDARVVLWNGGAERVLGWPEAEAVGMLGESIFTPEQRAGGVPEAELNRARRDGRAEDVRWHVRQDGSRFWANGMMIALRDDAGALRGYAKILRDETERKSAEDDLDRLRQTLEDRVAERTVQVRHLAAQLADIEAEGRRRAAAVLHDDVQQRLYGVTLGVGDLVRALEEQADRAGAPLTDLAERARRVRQWAEEALDLTRRLAADLDPPSEGADGLEAGLAALAVQVDDLYGFRLDLDVDGADAVPAPSAVLVLQAVREAVFNAVKHSGTDHASVRVRAEAAVVEVVVADDGAGYDPATAAVGLGRVGLQSRMALVGGDVRVRSAPGRGTRVTLRVPRRERGAS